MAFSEEQAFKMRFYLGAGDLFHGNESNIDLDSRIAFIGTRPAAQAEVEAILASLQVVEDGLGGIFSGDAASHGSLKRVEEIEFYNDGGGAFEDSDFRKRGRMLCKRLAIILDTDVQRDVFGNGSRVIPWGLG